MAACLDGLRTPDGRYLIVRGRLWRLANPHLAPAERTELIAALMAARRDVGRGRRRDDVRAVGEARTRVEGVKRALGERGPVWWKDGAPDYNRRLVHNTPYQEWFERIQEFADKILTLLSGRADGASICPSEVARAVTPRAWRVHLEDVRQAGRHLARQRTIVIRQRGRAIDPDTAVKGPIRYAWPN